MGLTYTNEQKTIIESDSKHIRVIASPGSGKTSTIIGRVENLIRGKKISPYNICMITFTRSAAKEMKDRIEKKLAGTGHRVSKMFIGTSHSLCVRILRQWGELISFRDNFTIYDEIDQKDIIKDICSELKLKAKPQDVMKAVAKIMNEGTVEIRDSAVAVAFEYLRRLHENNAFDYDLLLLYAIKLLRDFPQVREHYRDLYQHMIYDESQDIAPEEYELIRLIDPENLMVVGDPNQELYAFRGTSNKIILEIIPTDYPEIEKFYLTKNFRSRKEIIDVANRLISNNPDQSAEMEAVREVSGYVGFQKWSDKDIEAAAVADIVEDVRDQCETEGELLDYKTVAVLFRTNRQAKKIAEALENAKIPCQVVNSAIKFYQLPEIKRFIMHLQLIHNPKDNYSIFRIISEYVSKRRVSEVQEIRIKDNLTLYEAVAQIEHDGITFLLDEIRVKIEEGSLVTILDIAEELERRSRFFHYYAAQGLTTKAENIQRLFVFLKDWQEQFPDDHTLEAFIEWYGTKTAEDLIKKDVDAVQLMTIHQAKGREWPCVIIAGACEGLLPMKRGDLFEERRMMFVAATRAKDELYVLSPLRNYGQPVERSRFVGEMVDG